MTVAPDVRVAASANTVKGQCRSAFSFALRCKKGTASRYFVFADGNLISLAQQRILTGKHLKK